RQERLRKAGDAPQLAYEVTSEVDHVRSEVAERTRACLVRIEAPGVERRVVAPVLQVARAEVTDLADPVFADQLAREADGGHEAVVEAAEVLDARRGDGAPDLVALVGRPSERLLAEDVLAGLRRGDRRLGVQRVRAAVVEQADAVVGDQVAPVRRRVVVAVPRRRIPHRLVVPPRDADEPRNERRRRREIGELAVRVRVRLAHEGVADHPYPDLWHCAIVRGWRTGSNGGFSRPPTSTGR